MNRILYIEYAYFQLEGIPPYPSPYVTIDAQDKWWVSLDDSNKMRYERTYRTRESTPQEGVERYFVSTGINGKRKECSFYERKENCQEIGISEEKTFDKWLEEFTAVNRKMIANLDKPSENGGYEYKGKTMDSEWGEVYIFERSGIAQASDLYNGKPMVETIKIDVAQFRLVELTKIVITDEKYVVHSSYRLSRWDIIDETQAPAKVFETLSPIGF